MQFEEIIKLQWRDVDRLLLENGPKDCTWHHVVDYIQDTYTQDQILAVNVLLWKTLDGMDLECEEADEIRDACDPWWYAMNEVESFHAEIKQYLKENGKMS